MTVTVRYHRAQIIAFRCKISFCSKAFQAAVRLLRLYTPYCLLWHRNAPACNTCLGKPSPGGFGYCKPGQARIATGPLKKKWKTCPKSLHSKAF
jgi:hypothetical protein